MRWWLVVAIFGVGCESGSSGTGPDAASDAAGSAQLALTPASLDLGNVCLGTATSMNLAITNTGTGPGTVAFAFAGTHANEFALSATTCTGALAPASSCTATVRFEASSPGAKAALLTASTPSGGAAQASLTASGSACSILGVSPTTISFAMTAIGSATAAQTVTLTNMGSSITTGAFMVQLAGANPADFERVTDTCNGVALPPSGQCSVSVRFRPTMTGGRSAALDFSANPGGVVTVALSGLGTL